MSEEQIIPEGAADGEGVIDTPWGRMRYSFHIGGSGSSLALRPENLCRDWPDRASAEDGEDEG